MRICLLLGGPLANVPDLSPYKADYWIGIDRGALRLLNQGIMPQTALGDFDSLSTKELVFVREQVTTVKQYPAEKDQTDAMIGVLYALAQQPDEILIFGATGGRMDHLLANLFMLTYDEYQAAIPLTTFIDKQNRFKLYQPGKYAITKEDGMTYVAFTVVSDKVDGLTLEGFKYPLTNASYRFGSALSSNEFIEREGVLAFSNGLILMSQSKD
ncbi:kinase [Brochothrix campestris FSL F6-1037]|uniref:Thiamine diphosphokinase n=2 Tax=Brochothrix campestris TaxID=2757 RepID=W7D1P2_9LIST|nr:kinase [Brochothrix campestris FSL F6-1037]